jgi:hypothetical protein
MAALSASPWTDDTVFVGGWNEAMMHVPDRKALLAAQDMLARASAATAGRA